MNLGTFSGGGLGMGVAFTLHDKFTGTSAKLKKELASLGSHTDMMTARINRTEKVMRAGFQTMTAGAVIVAPFALGIAKAAQLSDQLADVQKTTGLAGDELMALKENLAAMDTRTTQTDLLGISAIGGQLGVAQDQIEGFTAAIDKAVVALGDEFSGGAEQVSKELGKIGTVYKETKALKIDDALIRIGSAINELGAAGAATGPNIADFTKRIGEMGNLAPTIQQTMGLAAAVEEMGMSPELAASGFKNFTKQAGNYMDEFAKQVGMTRAEFEAMFNRSTNETLLTVAESFKGMSNAEAVATMKELHIRSNETQGLLLAVANNTGLVVEKQTLANKAFGEGTSLLNEFNVKNNTLGARLDKLRNRFEGIVETLGIIVIPIFEKLLWVVEKVGGIFSAVASTGLGRTLLQLTFIVGGLATVIGFTVTVLAALRLVLYKATLTFVPAASAVRNYGAKTAVAATQVQLLIGALKQKAIALGKGIVPALRGAIPALRAFGASLYTALGPFIVVAAAIAAFIGAIKLMQAALRSSNPLIRIFGVSLMFALGPIGMIVGAITLLKRAWDEFNNVAEDGSNVRQGFVGVLQRIGGILHGVYELWSAFNAETGEFTMSRSLYNKLKALGIEQLVADISTWLQAAKAVILGFAEGFSEAAKGIGDAVLKIVNFLTPGEAKLKSWNDLFTKNSVSMEKWKKIGKAAAYGIIAVVGVLTVAFATLGLTMLAAMIPVLLIIGAVAAAAYGLGYAAGWLAKKTVQAAQWIREQWDGVAGTFRSWWDWMVSLPSKAFEWGRNLVIQMWEGIKSLWDSTVGSLMGMFGIEPTLSVAGAGGAQVTAAPQSPTRPLMQAAATQQARQGGAGSKTIERTETVQSVTVVNQLDGREIHRSVFDREKLQEGRR